MNAIITQSWSCLRALGSKRQKRHPETPKDKRDIQKRWLAEPSIWFHATSPQTDMPKFQAGTKLLGANEPIPGSPNTSQEAECPEEHLTPCRSGLFQSMLGACKQDLLYPWTTASAVLVEPDLWSDLAEQKISKGKISFSQKVQSVFLKWIIS